MNSIFGPRVMPRRSAATAPFGGGDLGSSSVIKTWAAYAGNDTCMAVAAQNINSPLLKPRTTFSSSPRQISLAHAAVADDRIRRPEQEMGVRKFGFTIGAEIAGAVGQRHHGLPQGLAARQLRIVRL